MRITSMWWLAALTACGSSNPDTAALVFDPCDVTRVDAPGATGAQLASLDAALAAWSTRGMRGLVHGRDPQISVVFRDGAPSLYGFYDEVSATVYVNLRIDDDAQRAVTIAHELGHALGLEHVSAHVRSSVMNPGNVTILPTADDAAALISEWGTCSGTSDAPPAGEPVEGD